MFSHHIFLLPTAKERGKDMEKIKSLILCFAIMLMLIVNNSSVFADEENACALSYYPIPDEGEVILLEDNSTYIETTGAVSSASVNKTYSVRIQDSSGSCVSSAKVTVKGSYTYDKTSNNVLSSDLSASFASVPSLWTASIQSQWSNISGTSLSYYIYYKSKVDDPLSCMVGGGYWYSGQTFSIR